MITPQRKLHRVIWLLLTPLLLGLLAYFSQPQTDLYPPNADMSEIPEQIRTQAALHGEQQ